MGIISKTPRAPLVQPYVPTVQQPIIAQPVEPVSPLPDNEELSAEARKGNLLRRSRGRFGTILTGFRGFLSPHESSSDNSRKTLLGE